jgi:hypothetical protein
VKSERCPGEEAEEAAEEEAEEEERTVRTVWRNSASKICK